MLDETKQAVTNSAASNVDQSAGQEQDGRAVRQDKADRQTLP